MHSFLILLHLLLLTYWLGGDLGVFYTSRYVLRPDLPVQTRAVAARIMSVLDMSPRVCLVLFLPSGISLVADHPLGRNDFGGWVVAIAWVGSLIWLSLVIADFRLGDEGLGRAIRRVDYVVRYCLVAGLLGVAAYTIFAAHPFGVDSNPRWLGGKVALYATAMACGLGIRSRLKPFGPAFARLIGNGSTPDVEATLARSVRGSLPFVYTIWACVAGAAVLGVVKPGAHLPS